MDLQNYFKEDDRRPVNLPSFEGEDHLYSLRNWYIAFGIAMTVVALMLVGIGGWNVYVYYHNETMSHYRTPEDVLIDEEVLQGLIIKLLFLLSGVGGLSTSIYFVFTKAGHIKHYLESPTPEKLEKFFATNKSYWLLLIIMFSLGFLLLLVSFIGFLKR
jgi:hypothetical protein